MIKPIVFEFSLEFNKIFMYPVFKYVMIYKDNALRCTQQLLILIFQFSPLEYNYSKCCFDIL